MDSLIFYTYDDYTERTTLDLGAVAASSSDDQTLQVINTSDSYQAQSVTVSVGGDNADQLFLSTDGDTFYPSITVGDISPGAGCPYFYLRRVTPSSAATGTFSATLNAAPAAWTGITDTATSTNIALDVDTEIDTGPGDDRTSPPDVPV